MTDTIISQNIDLSFWITGHIKQLITSGWQLNSAVLACVLALDRNVSNRRKLTPLQHNRSLNSLQICPTPHFAHTSQHSTTHMRIQVYACGVLSNLRQNTAQFANRRQTYSIFTPAFTLCLFLPILLSHSLPSFPYWYLFLWSVL